MAFTATASPNRPPWITSATSWPASRSCDSLYALQDATRAPARIHRGHARNLATKRRRASPSHGRTILRHLGEYTLFMSGIFRERLMARGELGYYLAHGSSAYWRCADGELNPRQRQGVLAFASGLRAHLEHARQHAPRAIPASVLRRQHAHRLLAGLRV